MASSYSSPLSNGGGAMGQQQDADDAAKAKVYKSNGVILDDQGYWQRDYSKNRKNPNLYRTVWSGDVPNTDLAGWQRIGVVAKSQSKDHSNAQVVYRRMGLSLDDHIQRALQVASPYATGASLQPSSLESQAPALPPQTAPGSLAASSGAMQVDFSNPYQAIANSAAAGQQLFSERMRNFGEQSRRQAAEMSGVNSYWASQLRAKPPKVESWKNIYDYFKEDITKAMG